MLPAAPPSRDIFTLLKTNTAESLYDLHRLPDMKTQVHRRNAAGETPLHIAARMGLDAIVETMLVAGADVKATSPTGVTPLHHAAERGLTEAIKSMVARGAKINAKNSRNETPVLLATQSFQFQAVSTLLALKADPWIESLAWEGGSQETLLHRVCKTQGNTSPKLIRMVQVLVDGGVPLTQLEGWPNTTALHNLSSYDSSNNQHIRYAMARIILQAAHKKNIPILEIPQCSGYTVLSLAAEHSDHMLCDLFLKFGANINVKDLTYRSTMHFKPHSDQQLLTQKTLHSAAVKKGCSSVFPWGKQWEKYLTIPCVDMLVHKDPGAACTASKVFNNNPEIADRSMVFHTVCSFLWESRQQIAARKEATNYYTILRKYEQLCEEYNSESKAETNRPSPAASAP